MSPWLSRLIRALVPAQHPRSGDAAKQALVWIKFMRVGVSDI